MWNERYASDDYVFGKAPSCFLQENNAYLKAGDQALAIADGEGRNSVYMAKHGLDVTAMDSSDVGLEKARKLARETGVDVNFIQGDLRTWDWSAKAYDLVVGIFFQFADAKLRAQIFEGMKSSLKPGGVIMIHGYTPKQVEYGTGGPGNPELMYTPQILENAFGDMEILRLEAYERELDEGRGHSGRSALIDLIARKT